MMTVRDDQAVDGLNLTARADLLSYVALLAGQTLSTPSRAAETRITLHAEAIKNGTGLGLRELNELLVLLGQNRISSGFFQVFFSDDPSVRLSAELLKNGLKKFRMWALLCEGNFRHPFQEWRRLSNEQVKDCFGHLAHERRDLQKTPNRSSRTIELKRLKPSETYATGVIAAMKVLSEFKIALAVCRELGVEFNVAPAKAAAVEGFLMKDTQELKPGSLTPAQVANVKRTLTPEKVKEIIERLLQKLSDVAMFRKRAIKHTEDYLLAAKIDVYVATSMREDWEFSETAEHLNDLFERDDAVLKHLDYFDPTQSYLSSPVDKGLLEGLMLNRVAATVYMAQESDTMGKDSELASTLAQGKPVIAFVPRIAETVRDDDEPRNDWKLTEAENLETRKWITKLTKRPMNFFRKRLYLLMGADILTAAEFHNLCRANGIDNPTGLLDNFLTAMDDFDPLFSLIPDEHDAFKGQHKWFGDFLRMFVFAEAVNFDKRATTLKKYHPLGLQIEVTTGTANGVLVVRDLSQCEQLLEAILLNDAKFRIVKEDFGTALVETISNSRFRVVTDEPVLTASFWNFFTPITRKGRARF